MRRLVDEIPAACNHRHECMSTPEFKRSLCHFLQLQASRWPGSDTLKNSFSHEHPNWPEKSGIIFKYSTLSQRHEPCNAVV